MHLDAIAAERPAKRVEEALSEVWRGRRREIGPATVAGVPVEGELRHREDGATDIRKRALHLSRLLEDTEAGDLRGELLAVLRAVVGADPEKHNDTRFDLGDALVADVDDGRADSLNDRAR